MIPLPPTLISRPVSIPLIGSHALSKDLCSAGGTKLPLLRLSVFSWSHITCGGLGTGVGCALEPAQLNCSTCLHIFLSQDKLAAITALIGFAHLFFFLLGFRATGPFIIMIKEMLQYDIRRFGIVFVTGGTCGRYHETEGLARVKAARREGGREGGREEGREGGREGGHIR